MIAGLVLAGGRSRRFGSEKATVRLDGKTLLEHGLDALRADCAALAVNTAAGSGAAAIATRLGLPVLEDGVDHPGGPLAGVAAGLAWAGRLGATHLATLPCDMPHAPTDLVHRLLAVSASAAFARTADGLHPLCAVWRIDLLAPLTATLAKGHPAVQAFLREIGGEAVIFEDAPAFANINRPGDL
ncbi:MAG: molybdenum cofactor guanylyltransferase [Caulobacter sp.]|nr:molybdenum cofactor guanylyltransferase [Caulobacter sp.]